MKKQALTESCLLTRQPDLMSTPLDQDLIMMDMNRGQYYSLNVIARDIWERLDTPLTLKTLCHSLTQKYAVDDTTCLEDVRPFVEHLIDMGLLCTAEQDEALA